VWDVVTACQTQLRFGGPNGQPVGLDFGAVFQMATALGADLPMLADVLPGIEAVVVERFFSDGAETDGGFGES
jgi:hypothetical protein